MAPPVAFNDTLLWVGSTGQVFTLPQFRIAGVYAPANGEFSTDVFTIPSTPMWANVVARWYGGLPSQHSGGGCDEGCNAYFFCAILDAESGKELPGYGVNETVVRMDVDALRLPLRGGDPQRAEAGGGGAIDGRAAQQHDLRAIDVAALALRPRRAFAGRSSRRWCDDQHERQHHQSGHWRWRPSFSLTGGSLGGQRSV